MTDRITAPRSWGSPRDHWVVAMEHPWYHAQFRIQDALVAAAHTFLRAEGMLHMSAPVTTGSISSPMGAGSDSLPVSVILDGRKTYLADSMQFALEYGCRMAPAGAYYIMQCFRGEVADETHLQQFSHFEFETPGGILRTMHIGWGLIQAMSQALLNEAAEDVFSVSGTLGHLEAALALREPPHVDFDCAISELGAGDDYTILSTGARALTRQGEKRIAERHAVAGAVWICGMDALAVPFYQATDPATGRSVSADLLLGGREVIGSGQRHITGAEVRQSLAAHAVDASEYQWYVRLKDLRPMVTSGLGLGLERFLMWVTHSGEIRDMPLISRLSTGGSVP